MNEICLYCHWLYFSSIIMSFGQGVMNQKVAIQNFIIEQTGDNYFKKSFVAGEWFQIFCILFTPVVCGESNCFFNNGFPSNYDCCEDPAPTNTGCHFYNNANDCCTKQNPCAKGEGDCDKDHDCIGDLVCGKDNCHDDLGFPYWGDCCKGPCNPNKHVNAILEYGASETVPDWTVTCTLRG